MDEEVEARCAREKACQPATGTEAYGAVGPDDVYLSHRGSFSGLEKKKKNLPGYISYLLETDDFFIPSKFSFWNGNV